MASLAFGDPAMMRIWGPVRELEKTLAPVNYITSLEDQYQGRVGGKTCAANAHTAAMMIVYYKSHRLATPAEIEKCLADEKDRADTCAAIELERGHVNRVSSRDVYEQAAKLSLAHKLDGKE